MPLAATFTADFTKFAAAVDAAEVKLKSFEGNVAKVDSNIAKFGNQFSGQKIISDALLMEKAIQEVGGVSKLTTDELARAGKAADAAADKLKRLGMEVPPQLEKLSKAAKDAEGNVGLIGKAADLAKSQFGQMFGALSASRLIDTAVSGLIDLGKTAIQTGGDIADMSDKTGLSTELLQQMKGVADQTGGSLEGWASAATKLGVNLAKGTDASREALGDLGLSLDKVRGMSEDVQFKTIIGALHNVEDASERNRIGIELFGKGFADVSAAVAQNAVGMMNSVQTMSAEQIHDLDAIGDAWSTLKDNVTTYVGGLIASTYQLATDSGLTDYLNQLDLDNEKIKEYHRSGGGQDINLPSQQPPKPPKPTKKDLKEDREAAAAAKKRADDAADAAKKIADEFAKQNTATVISRMSLSQLNDVLGASAWQLNQLDLASEKAFEAFQKGEEPINALEQGAKTSITEVLKLAEAIGKVPDEMKKIPAPTAGKGLLGNVGDTFGGNLSKMWESQTGGKGLGGLFGNMGSDIVSNLASGGISAAVNAGVALATKGLTKAWGAITQSESKKTNDERDKLLAGTYGTEDALRKLAFEAGATDLQVRKVFETKKVDDFKKALGSVEALIDRQKTLTATIKPYGSEADFRKIAEQAGLTKTALDALFDPANVDKFKGSLGDVTDALDEFQQEQDADAKRLDAAIEKYGFSFDELGKTLQNKKSQEQAKDLIEDWRVLLDAGVDVNKINEKMTGSIEEYVKQARRTGAEVPAAMRPMLQSMIDQGRLTDESGNKFDTLEHVGLSFTDDMVKGFDKIVKKLDELLTRLGMIPKALDEIPANTDTTITTHYEQTGTPPSDGSGDTTRPGPDLPDKGKNRQSSIYPGFQTGTHGRYLDFGQGTTAVLHGKERIVTTDEVDQHVATANAMVGAVMSLQVTLLRAMRENSLQVRDQIQLARA